MNITYSLSDNQETKLSTDTNKCLSHLIKQALKEENILAEDYRIQQVSDGIVFMFDVSLHLNTKDILCNWIRPNPTFNANIYDSKSRVICVTKSMDIIIGNVIGGQIYLDYLSPYYYGLKLNFNLESEILMLKVIN